MKNVGGMKGIGRMNGVAGMENICYSRNEGRREMRNICHCRNEGRRRNDVNRQLRKVVVKRRPEVAVRCNVSASFGVIVASLLADLASCSLAVQNC